MKPSSPIRENPQDVKVLILSWVPPTCDYVRTNHAVAEALRSLTLTSPPRGATRKPPIEGPRITVHTTVELLHRSYPAATKYAEEGKFKEHDIVVIVGFEEDKLTGKAVPAVILEKGARRLGYLNDPEGNKGEVEVNGASGFKGDKDFYGTATNVDHAMIALMARGYQSVETRDLSKDEIVKGGPVKPALCEYVAGQVLREVEGKEKPLVVLAHMTYEKGEKGHEGGPYTVGECIELTKCLAWYLAEQSVKVKA